ncbi:MAG: hypothetical protein JKY46_04415 [Robiginitomaculum sp.]|nr:hypothetical protein [Robiginitomaculum sp.]
MKRQKKKLSHKNSRRLKAAGGIGLIVVGIPLIPLPVPIGWAVTLTGVAVLTNNSDRAKRGVEKLVAKYPSAPRKFRAAKQKAAELNPFSKKRS